MRLRTVALAAVVLIGTIGSNVAVGEVPRPAARFRVRITEFAFTPRNLQVRVGDTIVWTNFGTMTHNSVAAENVWNSGPLAPEQSFSLVVNQTGNFGYRCTFHPQLMRGTVRVIP
jgi:plastocyanin